MPGTTAINALPYPVGSDGPAGMSQIQSLAQSVDSLVISRFATTALRDSTITAPVTGQMCVVGTLPQVWTGLVWAATSGANQMEVIGSASQNVGTSAWAKLGMTNVQYSTGSGFTLNSQGITVTTAGRYWCEANYEIAANSTGRRVIGVGSTSLSAPAFYTPSFSPPTPVADIPFSQTIDCNAGDTICLWVFQDCGGSLSVTRRRLLLRVS